MTTESRMRVAYLTAGAGGMYCGSCLNDNTLARALSRQGVDIQLIPIYTPIRTDEENVSVDRVFLGGINVYLQQKLPPTRFVPAWLDRILNHPALIRRVTRRDIQADPHLLGAMTVSMLQGSHGHQRKEVHRLLRWLEQSVHPQIVNFSNVLIAGCAPEIRRRLRAPVVVTLQGDDIFLDYLPAEYRRQAVARIQDLVEYVDMFVVHSEFYAAAMQELFAIPEKKLRVVPLGIDLADFRRSPARAAASPAGVKTIGYLARLAPEKGLHVLTEAFLKIRQGRNDVRLRMAGWLGTEQQSFAREQFARLDAAGLQGQYEYVGVVDRNAKVGFLQEVDLFSVPTTYREPKGLFALEAMAAGVPVVLPAHGVFPEMMAACPGGVLVRPEDPDHLAAELNRLLDDDALCLSLGRAGQAAVWQEKNAEAMAAKTFALYQELITVGPTG